MVVCGTKKSGKTSILEQVIYGHIGPFPATIEDVYVANIDTDRGTKEAVRLYDTAGIDSKSSTLTEDLPKHLYPVADGYIIVYSIDDEHSFQVADVIRKDIEKHREKKDVCVIVLGNKTDLVAKRRVETVQALNWAAREKVRLFEVSALDRESLYEPFVHLSSKLNPPPNKSTFSQLTMGRSKQTSKASNE